MPYPNHQLQQKIDRIILLIDLKRLEHAQRAILEGLAAFPEATDLYLLQGQCFEQMEDKAAAITAYKKVLALEPENFLAHQRLADLYNNTSKKALAEKHLEDCLRIAPNDAAVLALASLIYANNHPFKANRFLKRAAAADPNNYMVKHAEAYHNIMGLKLGNVKKMLIKNMKENPTAASTMFGMGLVQLSNGHFKQAADLLRQSYVKEPDEEKLDAWIDARLANYWPFSWSVRAGWITYPFGIGVQLFAFLIGLILFFLMTLDWAPHYDNWLWLVHLSIAIFLGLTYVLKYPVQYAYRLKHHSEAPKLTHRDFQKLALLICTIAYGIVIFTKEISLLLGSIFFLIYLPFWHLVAKRTHWVTKTIYMVIYGIVWASFIFSNLGDWFGWGLDKLFLAPALFGWVILLLGNDLAESWEQKRR